jgi:hypothetical protein
MQLVWNSESQPFASYSAANTVEARNASQFEIDVALAFMTFEP